MKRMLLSFMIVISILASGCLFGKTVDPVDPVKVEVTSISDIKVNEFKETQLTVRIQNKDEKPIESVSAASLGPFTIVNSGQVNIPGMKDDEPGSAAIVVNVRAPGFKSNTSDLKLKLSYQSGSDKKGNPFTTTKNIPVKALILPDAKLQFVGFVKGMANISEAEVTAWTINKGENATITFSVKNFGKTTIDENTLTVFVDVEEKRIGSNKTITMSEAMAWEGTSYTRGVELPIYKNAPNGKTNVFVKLLMGDEVLDTRKLELTVRL